jgi:hypothetical protein
MVWLQDLMTHTQPQIPKRMEKALQKLFVFGLKGLAEENDNIHIGMGMQFASAKSTRRQNRNLLFVRTQERQCSRESISNHLLEKCSDCGKHRSAWVFQQAGFFDGVELLLELLARHWIKEFHVLLSKLKLECNETHRNKSRVDLVPARTLVSSRLMRKEPLL